MSISDKPSIEAARISAGGAQEELPAEAGEKPLAEGDSYYGVPPGQDDDVPASPHIESQLASWLDWASQRAEERLQNQGIQLPWHYGERFGEDHFRVVGLRAGGSGAVFVVESARFGERRLYAAKTLQYFLKEGFSPADTIWNVAQIALDFLEEAVPWLEMGQHPGIVSVQLFQKIVHPKNKWSVPFIFSNFMEQGSLRNWLWKKGKLEPEKEVLNLGLQICDGLLYAYKHGLSAHRDLKPENILVYQEGIYQVTDFSAGVMGTRGYMPPEQVIAWWKKKGDVELVPEGIPIDQRADQFALALTLLEASSGKHPFPIAQEACKGPEQARAFVERSVGEVPDGLVPGSLREVLARALSPRPEDRFPEISVFREALLRVYQAEFGLYQPTEIKIDDSWAWWFDRGRGFYLLGLPARAEEQWKEASDKLMVAIHAAERNGSADSADTGQLPTAEDYLEPIRKPPGGFLTLKAKGQFSDSLLKEILDEVRDFPRSDANQRSSNTSRSWVPFPFDPMEPGPSEPLEKEAYLKIKKAKQIFWGHFVDELDQALRLLGLAAIYRNIGQFPQAEIHLREALGIFRAIAGTEEDQASCLRNLGTLYLETQRGLEARQAALEALEICERYPAGTEPIREACQQILERVGKL